MLCCSDESDRGLDNPRMSTPFMVTDLEISDRDFSFLASVATSHLGIKLSDAKKPMVAARLLRRLRRLQLPSFGSYCERLRDPAQFVEEFPHFSDLVTTHKTDFFREAEHFRLLTQVVLPDLLRNRGTEGPLRFWSAGCSTGEEPYTIAMVMEDFLESATTPSFSVKGTDISVFAPEAAPKAIYHTSTIGPIPQGFRSRFLLRSRDKAAEQVRFVPGIRAKVSFEIWNLCAPNWGRRGPYDVIFCRNVLIYFDRDRQASIIARLCDTLRPGGYLFLGLSDSYVGSLQGVRGSGRSLYQKK